MPDSYSFMSDPKERKMPNWKLQDFSVVWDEDAPDAASDDAFDPSAYSVADVKAYIDDYPDERAAVLAAEQAGKGRVTLIDWLSNDDED
jgi:hypothetical protein